MRNAAIGILAMAMLVACSEQDRDAVARASAKSAVNTVVENRFPGVPLTPAVNCIIDGASANEIIRLAADGVTGPSNSTADLVIAIATRPDTLVCLATRGVPPLLA